MSENIGGEGKTLARTRLPFFYGWLLVGVSFVSMRKANAAGLKVELLAAEATFASVGYGRPE